MKVIFEKLKQKFAENKFGFFIFGALFIAISLMLMSLWAYNEFGSAQLDLSRPSYQEAREQAKKDAEEEKNRKKEESEEFSSEGKIDKKIIDSFLKKYDNQLQKIDADFFKEDALSDETLNLASEE